MLLDFKAVKGGHATQTFEVRLGDPLLEGFFATLISPLEVTARIQEQPHRSFLVEIRIEGQVVRDCRRCLVPVSQPVQDRTLLLYQVQEVGGPPGGGTGEQEVLPLRSHFDRVEIGPHVREVLFLAVENFPLCKPDCAGLCAGCGQDLNVAACGCAAQTVDRRWEGCRTWFDSRAPACRETACRSAGAVTSDLSPPTTRRDHGSPQA